MRIVVLISGSGSNLQAIIDACEAKQIEGEIVAVISNIDGVKGLERAFKHSIPTEVLDHKAFESREQFDQALQLKIDGFGPDLVVLAGFMRILTPEFTAHYAGRMLNIHPSLLPKYQGLNTHKRALKSGDVEHGVTVHFVTAELDGGPAVIQAKVLIEEDDTEASLAARVLKQEHIIYPLAVEWFCAGALKLENGVSVLNGETLPSTGHLIDATED